MLQLWNVNSSLLRLQTYDLSRLRSYQVDAPERGSGDGVKDIVVRSSRTWCGERLVDDDQRSQGWTTNTGRPLEEGFQDVRAVREAPLGEIAVRKRCSSLAAERKDTALGAACGVERQDPSMWWC